MSPDIADLAARVLALTPAESRPKVLIDGGSGAGKTQLARALVAELNTRLTPVTLVSLDDVYPGWSGLAAASLMVPGIVDDHRPGHPTWNWELHQFSGWVDLPDDGALVVEGCGAITAASRALATAAIWCDLDAATRKVRALDRDGEGFRPWWTQWAAQEAEHWRQHRPRAVADIVVDLRPAQ